MSAARGKAAALFLLGLILGAAGGSWGQRAAMHRMMKGGPKHALERLTRELGLNEDQKAKIGAVLEAHKPKFDALRGETFDKLDALRAEADAEIKKFLTPEQSARFDAMSKERRRRLNWEAPGGPDGLPPPPPR